MPEPTNAELLIAIREQNAVFIDHAREDHEAQMEQRKVNIEMAVFKAETEGKLAKLDKIPTKDELPELIEQAMRLVIQNKGKAAYAGLLVVAGIVGALVVISGGLKSVLGWIGFSYLGK